MKKRLDSTDTYYIETFAKILHIMPHVAVCALITFTAARICGYFSFVSIGALFCFDGACISYFFIAHLIRRVGILENGAVSERLLMRLDIILPAIIVLQWNLISYIFPVRTLWGYAPMFVLLCAFLFRTRMVLMEIAGLSVSIAISWILEGDKLLPLRDELYEENLVLRIVALIISFVIIYILTRFAENFTKLAKQNESSLAKKNEELESMSRDIIDFTADLIEQRDATSGVHVKRMKNYTKILADQFAADHPEYNLTPEKIEYISLASALHDVGKICIPDSILQKPAILTPEEFEVIKTHTTLGANIIDKLPASVDEEYRRYCHEICLYHHEKYDGHGYPVGLSGDDIPIAAQLVSVVDCFDALTSIRPYKNTIPSALAVHMILDGQCGAFSEKIKCSLIACKDKLIL